ncbi:hypothetical protein [Streptomyces sp. NRRL S-1448]|uniref:hypothetical protein n=1 Tax=Streptomyces sp. NRRL S-1448 TaxID=1463883 RepID=UPI000A8E29A9|nr:hypothetical protein [Streptomyces sp. NRRL S-1448]
MRTRIWITSAAMGATLLIGGAAATAQAAPSSSSNGTTASTSAAGGIYVGSYRTLSACKADGRNSAQQWTCVPRPDGWFDLYVYN